MAVVAYLVFPFALVSVVVASVQYECSSGCSLNKDIMGPPVEGSDGQIYMNACLATCQGVLIRGKEGESDTRVDTSGSVTEEDMFRYNEEGFRLVSKRLSAGISGGEQQSSDNNAVNIGGEDQSDGEQDDETGFINARRISYIDGLEYATKYNTTELVVSPRGEYLPSLLRPTPRNVIGEDRRTLISNTTVYPYSVVGQLEFGDGKFCSGTVISRNAFLTAAHCIYDVDGKDWFELKRFVPGRFRSDDNTIQDPFGEWYATSATVYQSYVRAKKEKHRFNFDYAVVLLAPREDACTFIGDVVGFAGIRKTKLGEKSLNDAKINGYPEDMPYGSMWTTGKCRGDAFDCLLLDHYVCYYCDTAGGLSGAALLDSENYVIGAHTNWFERFGEPVYNGGTIIDTDWRLQNTIDWSQRGVQLPVCGYQNKTVPTKSGFLLESAPSNKLHDYCFSSHAQVEVKGKGTVAMHSVAIGDRVLAGNGQYASVYSFAHFDRDREAEFLRVKLKGQREYVLEITAGHLLFVNRRGEIQAQAASSIRVGDDLIDQSGSTAKIIKIASVLRRGVFAPFTTTGDIVVNGILASTYATFNGRDRLPEYIPYQWLAHVLVAPRRLFCSWSCCESEAHTDEGIALWLSFCYWIVQQRNELQIFFLLALAPFALSIYFVEKIMLCAFLLKSLVGGCIIFLLIGLWKGTARCRKH